jgi:hypothetical protein
MRRLSLVAAAVVLVAAAAGGASASASREAPCQPHRLRVWLVHRSDPTRPRPVKVAFVRLRHRSVYAMLWAVATERVHGRRVVVGGGAPYAATSYGSASLWPGVYVNGEQLVPSPSREPFCVFPTQPSDTAAPWVMLDKTEPVRWEVYAATYDDDAVPLVSNGWVATPVSGGAVHVIGRGDTGADVLVSHIEHFTGTAPVRGGRWGSVAFAGLPCVSVGYGAGSGVGEGDLAGGDVPPMWRDSRHMDCSRWELSSGSSNGPTTWQVTGEATGYDVSFTRLAVFDLPKP